MSDEVAILSDLFMENPGGAERGLKYDIAVVGSRPQVFHLILIGNVDILVCIQILAT